MGALQVFSYCLSCIVVHTLTVHAIHIAPHKHFIKLHDSWSLWPEISIAAWKIKPAWENHQGTGQGNSDWTLYFEILCAAVWCNWVNTHRAQTQYPAKAFSTLCPFIITKLYVFYRIIFCAKPKYLEECGVYFYLANNILIALKKILYQNSIQESEHQGLHQTGQE